MLIDRHLVVRFLRAFAGVLAATLLLYGVIDFCDRSSAYTGPGWAGWAAQLYAFRLVKVAVLLSPLASLLAAGLTVSALRRRSEWAALLAAGASPLRLVVPLLLAVLAMGALTAVFDDRVGAAAALRAERISTEHFHLWGSSAAYFAPKRWVRAGPLILHLGALSPSGGANDVSLFRIGPDFTLAERIDADQMVPQGHGRFRLEHARRRRFQDLRQTLVDADSLDLDLPEVQALFDLAPGRPEMLTRDQLARQVAARDLLGLPDREQRFEAASRVIGAFAGLAGALIALALALRPNRRGHVNASLVEGVATGAALWALMGIFKSLAVAGRIGPVVGAAAPLALGAAVGLAWLWRVSLRPGG